ncbi:hypothetical protein SNK04_014125 [Fusarium graminearum]
MATSLRLAASLARQQAHKLERLMQEKEGDGMADARLHINENRLRVDTVLTDDYRVIQTLDVFGEVTKRVANVAAMQMEDGIREQLIRLGWTPPRVGRDGDGHRAARGTWVDVVDLLQGQEQRGVRAPLRAIAEAVGAPLELVVELASAGVLCGSDDQGATFSWAATHAGMRGDPVKLVDVADGSCWYCPALVVDDHSRRMKSRASQRWCAAMKGRNGFGAPFASNGDAQPNERKAVTDPEADPKHPSLLAAIAEGGTLPMFTAAAKQAARNGKGFVWAVVQCQRDAGDGPEIPAPQVKRSSRADSRESARSGAQTGRTSSVLEPIMPAPELKPRVPGESIAPADTAPDASAAITDASGSGTDEALRAELSAIASLNVPDVVDALPTMNHDELLLLHAIETDGKKRVSVLAAIDEALTAAGNDSATDSASAPADSHGDADAVAEPVRVDTQPRAVLTEADPEGLSHVREQGQDPDPAGLLTGKNAKYADPLGITKTAIGDPTGDLRKERSRIAAEKEAERLAAEDAKNVLPKAQAAAARAASEATSQSLNERLKRRRSSFAVSLMGQGATPSSLLASGNRS